MGDMSFGSDGGFDQSRALLKSTVPPENWAFLKLTRLPPENWALLKPTVQPENSACWKLTLAPGKLMR